jgi:DNA-binding MarR family transcriptional regulator
VGRPQVLVRAPRRTMALLHIASNPEASNREIAAAIGMADDAQISRLLARMHDLGLIVNRTQANNHGGANAWQLTTDGARIVSALKESLA